MGLLTIILNERVWKERVRQPRLLSRPAPVQPPANRAAQPPRRGRSALQGSLECGTALWVRRRGNHSCNPSPWQRPFWVCKSWKSVGVSTERLIQASVLRTQTQRRGWSAELSSEPAAHLQGMQDPTEVFQKLLFAVRTLEQKLQVFLGSFGQ